MDFSDSLCIFKTPSESTSAHNGECLVVKQEPEIKLVPCVKLERIETFECYKKTFERYLKAKRYINVNQSIKEEHNFQSREEKQCALPLDNNEIKGFDIYKHGAKEEDTEKTEGNVAYSKKILNDTKCNMNIIKDKIEFAVDNFCSSAHADGILLKNNNNRGFVTGDMHKITGKKLMKKDSTFNYENSTSSKYYTTYRNPKAYKCKECSKVLHHITKLAIHMRKVHKINKIFECSECHKLFAMSYLKQHIDSVHKRLKKYRCSICNKRFGQPSALKGHVNHVHKRIKRYQCNECGKTYHLLGGLKFHIDKVHRECFDKRMLIKESCMCYICHQKFFDKRKLKVHIHNFHVGITGFQCNKCKKEFMNEVELINHYTEVHEKSRGYICGECDKGFFKKQLLIYHIQGIHEKRFQCEQCLKCLYNKYTLKSHIDAVHKGIKRFDCNSCRKQFFGKSDLRCHMISCYMS